MCEDFTLTRATIILFEAKLYINRTKTNDEIATDEQNNPSNVIIY